MENCWRAWCTWYTVWCSVTTHYILICEGFNGKNCEFPPNKKFALKNAFTFSLCVEKKKNVARVDRWNAQRTEGRPNITSVARSYTRLFMRCAYIFFSFVLYSALTEQRTFLFCDDCDSVVYFRPCLLQWISMLHTVRGKEIARAQSAFLLKPK